jgi:hypothetical protein
MTTMSSGIGEGVRKSPFQPPNPHHQPQHKRIISLNPLDTAISPNGARLAIMGTVSEAEYSDPKVVFVLIEPQI